MKRFFIGCVLVFVHISTNAQNRIHGKITDQDHLPLPGASITISEINQGTTSGIDGSYLLTDLPDGTLRIQFSYIGYGTRIETVVPKSSDLVLDITLKSTPIETEEIIVTGAYNSTQHENAVKIDVLKLNLLRIKSTPNFMEVLTKIPGVDMISKGSGVSKPVIRGLSMNDILVLNNGVRFENYQYSSHHPLGIDEAGIDNVEVIKGPASLLYGSDAIGGVINFIREKPAPQKSLVGDYSLQLFSNSLGITNNLGIKASSGHFSGGLRAGLKSNADYLQGGGAYVPNSRFNEYAVKTNAGYTGKTGTFRLFYDHIRQNLGLVEEEAIGQITARGRECNIFYQQLTTDLVSSQNRFFLGNIKLEANASYQNTELIHFGEEDVYELQMRLATLIYETRLYLSSGKNTEYLFAFQGMNQDNKNTHDRETILLPDAMTSNYSGFFLFQHNFFRKLKLQAGIRYDYKTLDSKSVGNVEDTASFRNALKKNYGSFSGSLGATYHLNDRLLFRFNLANGYRTPNLAELTSNGQHETRYEVGDPDLVPENSYEADLSMHYHIDYMVIDLAGFYNLINNYIFISPTGDTVASGMPVYRYKQSNSTLFGGEAGFHLHPPFAKWLHFQTTFSLVVGNQENGNFLPFVPAHKLNFELRGEMEKLTFLHKAFASVNSSIAFNQNNSAPDETTTKGYTLFDFSMGGDIRTGKQFISIVFSVNNIFDVKYVDHLSTLKEVGLNDPGRNFTLSLKVPFGYSFGNRKENSD